MNLDEFRALSEPQRVQLVNDRLKELKEAKKGIKEFKSRSLEFSYPTAVKEMEVLGYAREKDAFVKEYKLTEQEVMMLKNLRYNYEFVMKRFDDQPKVKKRNDDQPTTTSVRVYTQVWKRWQEFSKEWSIFNSIDLMASALEEFMDRHGFESYDTLVQEGKIQEKERS
ncbi:hypothetical protein PP175_28845 (plasmid) [Aneurinibacillus sp. Ricciae_BoGa-3]|uniref:hypothetical protein n=1 Tax=Aneurinibacillus sp. Ricciae_BoGa-3 TaxID=3022697 RepID=UPI0023425DE3|nr:hypothetical protein [Aneurinibacillus sp. Ricciae_BoGa-3]WCK57199.1 hypothetical protein PP175_28845 [Aneurinibacillus sp. Ricciae_BoGa-3]